MVRKEAERQTESTTQPLRSGRWLVPGESEWQIIEPGLPDSRIVEDIGSRAPARISLVVLPPQWVTCQLFWLDTADEKAVPDLLAMQCERRALLRQDEVWRYRIVRREADRLLAQVFILENRLPEGLQVEGDARFEVLPRCLELPRNSICLWLNLQQITVAITGPDETLYFQSLPHRTLTPACCGDLRSVIWMATAQGWVETLDAMVWMGSDDECAVPALSSLGLKLNLRASPAPSLVAPKESLELIPRGVQVLRRQRHRSRQVQRAVFAVVALYVLFLISQIIFAAGHHLRYRRLQAEFQQMLPEMTDLQNTAHRMDVLSPVLDTRTYPIEVLHRVMALLPDGGVRLTRFEILDDRVELAGESTTAREAFDFLQAIQTASSLDYITWEDPPQPVPLPNDTTRFSIQGNIAGAYHHVEEP